MNDSSPRMLRSWNVAALSMTLGIMSRPLLMDVVAIISCLFSFSSLSPSPALWRSSNRFPSSSKNCLPPARMSWDLDESVVFWNVTATATAIIGSCIHLVVGASSPIASMLLLWLFFVNECVAVAILSSSININNSSPQQQHFFCFWPSQVLV